ncbi:hypothetical protein AVI51_15075 [Piscirickettsia salmonis]|uniref:Helix-turn-helix protein n=1 Tax=Piscirickettsia salmonis TaxID=1238 RepID=A0A9Q5YK66_PISSA|nr:helix-turn-helix transcriptional regulator [Piscirickettsia salmonis]ALA24353.1 helix-turn-helix family protein [Piscirickettsia salmonis]APS44726.1 hypothetical protein AVI48_10360 [Piscirickettsia salmonis]APS48086.1 hypothetical protein AVI49_10965 [Piscirickettsia salmonis]APS52042.1 hypothetical protein AVI50_15230 [Piscirickettsia salmonis]APS55260.1 hypothetical protein AVI51_15075 [Piscirickettsia salmonis]
MIYTKAEYLANNLKCLLKDESIDAITMCRLLKEQGYQISQATISNILNGKTSVNLSIVAPISTFFNITISELIGETPIPKNRRPAKIPLERKMKSDKLQTGSRKLGFTKEQVESMQHQARQGIKLVDIAKKHKTTDSTIARYIAPNGALRKYGLRAVAQII